MKQPQTKQDLLRLTKKQILKLGGYKNIKDFYEQDGMFASSHSGRNKFGSKKHLAKMVAHDLKQNAA